MKVPANKKLCTLCKEMFSSQPELRQHMTDIHGKAMHECLQCGKEFCRAVELQKHAGLHTRQHMCSYCSKTFSSSHSLKIHVMTHTGERPHACTQCDKKFVQPVQLRQHLMNYHGGFKPYACSYCSKGFCTPSALKIHETMHTGEKLYTCSLCGKGFRYSSGYKLHMNKNHNEEYMSTLAGPSTPTTPETVKVEPLHKCPYCQDGYSDQEDLRTHMLSHSVGKGHICSYCFKGFSQSSQLKVHIMTHTGEKPQGCSLCNKRFIQISSLQAHMQNCHGVEKPYKCSYCSKSFRAPSYLKNHEVTHTGKQLYDCAHCSKSFNRYTTLKMHMKTHMNKEYHDCPDCGKKFSKLSRLTQHTRRYHIKMQDPEGSMHESNVDEPAPVDAQILEGGEKPHSCSHCGKSFGKLFALQRHLKIHTGQKLFSCSYCSKAFSTAYNLKIHTMYHTGEKPHKCSQCAEAFIHGWALKSHMLAIHGENNPFKCSYCSKEFSTWAELRPHETAHKNGKPWMCSYCKKQFRFRSSLRQHVETHEKVKQENDLSLNQSGQINVPKSKKMHNCLYCSEVFEDYSTLELHLTSHSGEVIFVCSHCNKSFPNMSALQKHTDEHDLNKPASEEHPVTSTDSVVPSNTAEIPVPLTKEKPYTCPNCGKGFRYRTDLKRHKLVHSGGRPHKCQYCPKAFKTASHLKFHTMIHTGDRPEKCSQCGKGFVQRSSLKWHIQNKHKVEETNSLGANNCEVKISDSSTSPKPEDASQKRGARGYLFETHDDRASLKSKKTIKKEHRLAIEVSPSDSNFPEKLSKSVEKSKRSDESTPSAENIKCEPCGDDASVCTDKTTHMSYQSCKQCDISGEMFSDTQTNLQKVRTSPRRKASRKIKEIIEQLRKKSRHRNTLKKGSPGLRKSAPAIHNSSKSQISPDPKRFARKLFGRSKCEKSGKVSRKTPQKLHMESKLSNTSNEASPSQPILKQDKDFQKLDKCETTSEDQVSKSASDTTLPDLASPNRTARTRKLPIRFRDEIPSNKNSAKLDKVKLDKKTKVVSKNADTSNAMSTQSSVSPKTNVLVKDVPNTCDNGVQKSEEVSASQNNTTENLTVSSDSCIPISDEASSKLNRASRNKKLPLRFRQEATNGKISQNQTEISQGVPIGSDCSKVTSEHESSDSGKGTQENTGTDDAVNDMTNEHGSPDSGRVKQKNIRTVAVNDITSEHGSPCSGKVKQKNTETVTVSDTTSEHGSPGSGKVRQKKSRTVIVHDTLSQNGSPDPGNVGTATVDDMSESGFPGTGKATEKIRTSTVNDIVEKGLISNESPEEKVLDIASTQRVPRMRKIPARYREEKALSKQPPNRNTRKEPMSPGNSETTNKSYETPMKHLKSRRTTPRCSICGKTLSSATTLMYHMRQHTGEKPYVCSFCNAGFARWCTLVIHKRIHTGDTPYKCHMCKLGFRQLPSLQMHMKRHPKKEDFYNKKPGRHLSNSARVVQVKRRQLQKRAKVNATRKLHKKPT